MPIGNGHASLLNGHLMEDTNSNIPNTKIHHQLNNKTNNLKRPSKFSLKGIVNRYKYSEGDDPKLNNMLTEQSVDGMEEDSLNITTTSCVSDNSMLKVPSVNEIVTPVLSPNG